MYTDERLTCTDCGAEFVFSAGEQQFFATRGFQNKPNRCPDCRAVRKSARQGGGNGGGYSSGGDRGGYGGGGGAREMYSVTCSTCGQQAEVPFQPRGDKPVYCRDCFQSQRSYR
ncbi:MAG TPA: zinc-ribbon domain containing protein [Candidatus Elarobacter sp.]|nr:zinc-ribbon domain containing protein [Candidatus Elarobacter sp.]